MAKQPDWNPFSPDDWARVLGFAHLPMFGAARAKTPSGSHTVLLDGAKSGFAVSSVDDSEFLYSDEPLSWCWSAHLQRLFLINEKTSSIIERRWDDRNYRRKMTPPKTPAELAAEFSRQFDRPKSASSDVITSTLRAFRRVRAYVAPVAPDPIITINVFNALLVGTQKVRAGLVNESAWRQCETLEQALSLFGSIIAIPNGAKAIPIGALLSSLLDPDPFTKCVLETDLLIRHAAGNLYQEAHFEIAREDRKENFLFEDGGKIKSESKRDARYTPASLARSLVEQALLYFGDLKTVKEPLIILDPAGGSGVFLQEALRMISATGFSGEVVIRGYDSSAVSKAIASFCLDQAVADAKAIGINVSYTFECRDALDCTWEPADIILMNPPFVPWNRMLASERELVRGQLGPLFSGHVDKAMAFVWKAVKCLKPRGVLSCIVPSPFLESSGGLKWREAIAKKCDLCLVGRFRGYAFFQSAMVEPAFATLKRRDDGQLHSGSSVRMVVAKEGFEDEALRSLRRTSLGVYGDQEEEYDVFDTDARAVQPQTWLPRSRQRLKIIEKLRNSATGCVRHLFDVHQGTLTGNNEAFILRKQAYDDLPDLEKLYFRPAVGSPTIRSGQIIMRDYVFYPYDEDGPTIFDDAQLTAKLPAYYERVLSTAKPSLESRSGVNRDQWWLLTRERSWQRKVTPKIVSAYFGQAGNFAYDAGGNFIVLQGYGWLWRGKDKDSHSPQDFYESDLPLAYVALLNSPFFEFLLAQFSTSVQGGQFNLSVRFVQNIPLPDLSDENQINGDAVREMSRFGKAMTQGSNVDLDKLGRLVALIYGIPSEEWESGQEWQ